MSTKEFNILIGNISEEDKELFFGPLNKNDEFLEMPEFTRYPQLLRDVGIFKSSSQARKNGWDKDISNGWAELTIGKLKHKIYILKIIDEKIN